MKCPECGNKITPKARFCDACGAALPQKKKPTIKDYFVTIIFLIVVIFLISLFFPKKEKDPAPEPAAAPAPAPASASVPVPSRPTLSEYADAYLDGTAREYFGPNHSIEVVADKEILVTIWQDGLAADVDAMKNGDAAASSAWRDLRDVFMKTSKQITNSMREVSTAGSYCTIFLVNESDPSDVFLIVSNGMLYYDCEIDRDPYFLYKRADQ